MHKVMKIIYDSALRDMLLNEDAKVIDNVLPSLAAYEALLLIKGILDTKEAERKKEQEKIQRGDVKPVVVVETPEPVPEVVVKPTASPLKKGQSMVQAAPIDMRSELEKEREAEREEIKKYGVSVSYLISSACGSGTSTLTSLRRRCGWRQRRS
jgi:hypothetical protein